MNSGRPHRCSLNGPATVAWAQAQRFPTGTTAQVLHVEPGGCEPKNRHLPSFQPDELDLPTYEHWSTRKSIARAIRISPVPRPYGASNVNNGVAWPVDMPNLWVSDPSAGLPQSIELDFGKTRVFDTVIVSFDTDLDPQANLQPPFWKASTCVKDWRLHAKVKGEWKAVYEERDNYQRRRTARFPAVDATGLRLEVMASQSAPGADDCARVYELRVYRSRG